MINISHTPIMVKEILSFFNLQPSHIAADLTTGEGGHSLAMAPLLGDGKLLCIDRDPIILAKAKKRLADYSQITFVNTTFDLLSSIRVQYGFPLFNAMLADLGVSMFHFKEASRGFSFEDTSLDMRLGGGTLTAEDVVNTFSEKELADIFYYYGEEHASRRIARAICFSRPFHSAQELSSCVLNSMGRKGKTHPATKIFQALRIYINEELEIAEKFLEESVQNLAEGGVFCILTFHSMEDRLVKNAFKRFVSLGLGCLPISKPLEPSAEEQKANPASRSAKLRVFQRS